MGVRVESSRACLRDPESSSELGISSCIFSFDYFNISNLLYLLELALLSASIYLSKYQYLSAGVSFTSSSV